MGADTKIEWTHHTFNPWHGCVKVSPGCTNCYAEAFDRRTHGTAKHTDAKGVVREPHWGKDAPRRFFGDAHWREPLKWNREAEKAGERRRVFCASMADVFEDRADLVEPRSRLLDLIHDTPALNWLLLTKRPADIDRLLTPWFTSDRMERPMDNIWLGTTVENQEQADRRIPLLLQVPAAVRFLSVEPLLGPVDLTRVGAGHLPIDARNGGWGVPRNDGRPLDGHRGIDWVIVGGESGPGARPCDVGWIGSIVEQCAHAGVACFVKQVGAHPLPSVDGVEGPWGEHVRFFTDADGSPARLRDPKGGDPLEWPEGLRVREFPEVRT